MESYKGVRTMSQGVFCVLAMSALMICLGCDQPATEGELPTSTSRASGTPTRSMIVPAASNATLAAIIRTNGSGRTNGLYGG